MGGYYGCFTESKKYAEIMGATAAILLNTNLGLLDSGEASFTVLGYAGLLGVIIADWTTANPTVYRVTLSFNSVFLQMTYKKMTLYRGNNYYVCSLFFVYSECGRCFDLYCTPRRFTVKSRWVSLLVKNEAEGLAGAVPPVVVFTASSPFFCIAHRPLFNGLWA